MSKFLIRAVSATATLVALGAPLLASAESVQVTSAVPVAGMTASARLDFRVTVPQVLFLQVGTAGAGVDVIDFTVTAANMGTGPLAGTGGDLGAGAVTARVRGNNGAINLTATTVGALSNGSGDTLSFSQIGTTSVMSAGFSALPAPVLVDGATSAAVPLPATAKVVNAGATWTYSYLNAAAVAPGVYGGANANNSRVTYTAVMP